MTHGEKINAASILHKSIGEKIELSLELLKESEPELLDTEEIKKSKEQKQKLAEQLTYENEAALKQVNRLVDEILNEGEEWKDNQE